MAAPEEPQLSTPDERAWPTRVTYLVFAAVLWFIATFAYLGNLGQWRDDYEYCKRDLLTGENLLTFGEPTVPYFYRPLYYMTQPWLQSELGGHWTNHLISAIVQAGTAALAYLLLRRQGVWRAAACGAAVALFVMPQTWEITFYLAAMPTGMSCLFFILATLMSLRWMRAERIGGWRAIVMPVAIFALWLAVPCWNEQVGAAAPAAAVLVLGERRSDGRRPWWRGVMAGALACGAQALYVGLYWATRPGTGRGSAETIIGLGELPERAEAFGRAMRFIAFMEHRFGEQAMRAGFEAMADQPGPAIAGVVCVVLAGGGWLARATRQRPNDSTAAREDRTFATIAFGLVVFVLAWVPLFMLRGQGVESRTWYPPAIGVVIAVAGIVHALVRWCPRPAVRFIIAAAFLTLVAPSLIALVGIQSVLHERMKLDERQAARLVELAPNPAPGTVFVPLEVMRRQGEPWSRFKETFCGPWEHLPAATPSIRAIYRRGDVSMGWRKRWAKLAPVLSATDKGIVYDDLSAADPTRLYRKVAGAGPAPTTLAWERVIPFVLDPAGDVVLVDEVSDVGDDGAMHVFKVETVKRLAGERPAVVRQVARVRLDKGRESGVNVVVIEPVRR